MPRQKKFVELSLLTLSYPTITDAYIAVYGNKKTRQAATASASRIYNKPVVIEYRKKLSELYSERALDAAVDERKLYLKRLSIG